MTARRRGRRAGRVWLREGGRRGEPRSPLAEGVLTTPTSCCSLQTQLGYSNLCRLITDAHMLGERSDPSVSVSQICAHAAGSVAVLGPASAAGRLAVSGQVDAACVSRRVVPGRVRT